MAPIHNAALNGNLNRVKALLDQGVHVNSRNAYGFTPLHKASRRGHLNIIQELLKRGAHVNSRNAHGYTPLHYAAYSGHLSVVQELLRRGAHVNPRTTRSGMTPLYVAAIATHPHIIHELMKAGTNPKYGNIYGHRAHNIRPANNRSIPNALKTSRAVTKWQNFRKKSIARKRAPNKNLAEKVFSPKRVRAMTAKYGNNWLNKV